jgi:hypothetical protein
VTDPLVLFLVRLATEPPALAAWLANPADVEAAAGLDAADRALLRAGSAAQLAARLSRAAASPQHDQGEDAADRGSAGRAPGPLTVVGTGIRSGQLTVDAIAHIAGADRVHYLIADPIGRLAVEQLNPRARSLADLYSEGKPRQDTYREMVDRVLASVRAGHRTCAVFYGHPGVFVDPAHMAVREARREGAVAHMLPGVSAEDCLFADLGVDPAAGGCQSYEATDFLVSQRRVDATTPLILWQVGVLGDAAFGLTVREGHPLARLVDRLAAIYPRDHRGCVYEAAMLPGCPARADWIAIGDLAPANLTIISTLYIPPSELPRVDFGLFAALTGPASG